MTGVLLDLGARRDHGLDEVLGDGSHLVAQLIAGDLAGLDGHFVLNQVFVAVLTLTEMELEVLAALGRELAAHVVHQKIREFTAFHDAAVLK